PGRSVGLEADTDRKNHSRLSERQNAWLRGNWFELYRRRRMRGGSHSSFGKGHYRRTLFAGRRESNFKRRSRHFGGNYRLTRAIMENPTRGRARCSLCGDSFFALDRPRTANSRGRRKDRAAHDVRGLLPRETPTWFSSRPCIRSV